MTTPSQPPNWESKRAELQHQSDLAAYSEQSETNRALLDAAIAFASAALKAALLINGGAAVAILAYLGNTHTAIKAPLPGSLLCFTGGVLLAAMATGGAYLAQFYYAHHKSKIGDSYRALTIAFVLSSYAAFAGGSFAAYSGFRVQATTTILSPSIPAGTFGTSPAVMDLGEKKPN